MEVWRKMKNDEDEQKGEASSGTAADMKSVGYRGRARYVDRGQLFA
jgi:hypothetical protein